MNQLRSRLWVIVLSLLLAACGGKEQQVHQHQPAAAAKPQTYTCPMHPQVVQQQPGTCPICGMDLVAFDKNNTEASVTIGEEQQALANISTLIVGDTSFTDSRQLHGRLVTDPSRTVYVSARVAGRIEALFVKETGVQVQKGQPLYKIYAEQLLSLQQEYLLANAQAVHFPDDARFQQIARAARQKLVLYGQGDAQLQQLLQQQKTNPYVVYTSPVNGVVAELSVTEGQYVTEGGSLMRLEDYAHLWAEADVYPGEAAGIKEGQLVTIRVAGWETQPQQVAVHFVTPALQPGSQLVQVRGTVVNASHQWQPGLQLTMALPSAGQGKVISLPVDAVIRDGKGMHVWVETGEGKYEPRQVTTGPETAEQVVIKEGLQAGDKVVVTGAYLLYSEYVLKKGKDPNSGHTH
jgi:Cu(I)/Ag(I) efflux system membrane fusion protein